jgi:hypothetical protein
MARSLTSVGMALFKSEWYVINTPGVKLDQCDPPLIIGNHLEQCPFIPIYPRLLYSHALIHVTKASAISKWVSLPIKPSNHNWSNALGQKTFVWWASK